MLAFFDGYKTKILGAIALLGAFLIDMGWITVANWDSVVKYIIPLMGMAIHHAITRASNKATAEVEDVKAKVATVERKVENVAPVVAQVVTAEVKAVVADKAPSLSYPIDAPHIHRP